MCNYYLPSDYIERKVPEYFVDGIQEIVWQPEVYDLAYKLAKKLKIKTILDLGAGNGEKLKKFKNEFKIVAVDYGPNVEIIKNNLNPDVIKTVDFENSGFEVAGIEWENTLVICADVIEHLIHPEHLLRFLGDISYKSPFVLVSTPDRIRYNGLSHRGPPQNPAHVREWSMIELCKLLKNNNFNHYLIGYTLHSNIHRKRYSILIISGTRASPFLKLSKDKYGCLWRLYLTIRNTYCRKIMYRLYSISDRRIK